MSPLLRTHPHPHPRFEPQPSGKAAAGGRGSATSRLLGTGLPSSAPLAAESGDKPKPREKEGPGGRVMRRPPR